MKRATPLAVRTPLARRTPLKARKGLQAGTAPAMTEGLRQRKPIPPVSRKRARENRERRAMVQRLYPERPVCAVWQARIAIGLPPLPGCTRWADDIHEPLSRARGGAISAEDNQLPPCRPCHDVLTFTPESKLRWAYQLNLLTHSWAVRA